MYKIAVLGDRDSVMGFRALGLETYFAEDSAEALPLLKKLASEETAVIYITELLASELKDEISRYKEKPIPAIIPVPGRQGSQGLGMALLKSAVERAVGADIL